MSDEAELKLDANFWCDTCKRMFCSHEKETVCPEGHDTIDLKGHRAPQVCFRGKPVDTKQRFKVQNNVGEAYGRTPEQQERRTAQLIGKAKQRMRKTGSHGRGLPGGARIAGIIPAAQFIADLKQEGHACVANSEDYLKRQGHWID